MIEQLHMKFPRYYAPMQRIVRADQPVRRFHCYIGAGCWAPLSRRMRPACITTDPAVQMPFLFPLSEGRQGAGAGFE